ncbi:MAG TPA: hypothetical protein VK452_07715 [Dissulfurispiraceae bacterium]|nr:hypothetical protein [Dissulfurispiraceae bacterium]
MKTVLAVLVLVAFAVSAAFAGTVEYQVTGPVLEAKDDKIVVQKGKEKWEIAKDKDTKTTGDVKVGDKVTIKYTMKATSIESKADKKADKKTDKKADKKTDKK